jgi:hypothetical protein
MATVPVFVKLCKPVKAYYAHLYDQAGVLTKVDGQLLFMADETGAITEVEPEDCTFLVALGQVGLAETQKIMDLVVRGGYAAVACGRDEGRS